MHTEMGAEMKLCTQLSITRKSPPPGWQERGRRMFTSKGVGEGSHRQEGEQADGLSPVVWVGFTLLSSHSLYNFCLQKVRVPPGINNEFSRKTTPRILL